MNTICFVLNRPGSAYWLLYTQQETYLALE